MPQVLSEGATEILLVRVQEIKDTEFLVKKCFWVRSRVFELYARDKQVSLMQPLRDRVLCAGYFREL
jgi:hypothetical protein